MKILVERQDERSFDLTLCVQVARGVKARLMNAIVTRSDVAPAVRAEIFVDVGDAEFMTNESKIDSIYSDLVDAGLKKKKNQWEKSKTIFSISFQSSVKLSQSLIQCHRKLDKMGHFS